ncbi:glycerophosphodiester phosphodiesterase [Paenibacillus sp. 7124]|uniref:Glycerophosphodiester phosphodiesterase n=1 Tax=Paenibacillus apii TaxID=1850370 RepID=A0A6M1PFT0_9BACL|nr:glycerophosphodiester phosphodiesterase family protein [Paenibacillus apii]NGM82006.1 glycerophosphodiester phosphodiesterase [Paenibacillus apii]NJJ39136.1 glycerophosphodiester phosphodiesterase [Paenibacillus apii]
MAGRFPLITAHTGCMNTPDNTLLSVEAGIRAGADIIEDDIRVTKDGIPVLAHDDAIYTVDGGEYLISKHHFKELSELEIKAHGDGGQLHGLCKLEDMLKLLQAAGKMANLDLKSDDSIEASAHLVNRYGMLDQVILSGCEKERALLAYRTHPELKRLLNADAGLFLTLDYKEAVIATCEEAMAASCLGINIHYRFVRSELLEYAASRGLPVCVWTVDDREGMRTFIGKGVYSITTRNVSELAEFRPNPA